MHAYLVIGTNKTLLQNQISAIVSVLKSKVINFPLKSIEEVRNLIRLLNLKLDSKTTLLIENISEATPEALNAFLKTLEEPQENLSFILTANSLNNLLPTIISRCQVVETGKKLDIEPLTLAKTKIFIDKSEKDKLLFISGITQREAAELFLTDLIKGAHLLLVRGENTTRFLALALKTLSAIKKNGNATLQLTNFSINLE